MRDIYNMATRRNKISKKKFFGGKNKTQKRKPGKKWETAIDVAQKTLTRTGSLSKARRSLKQQALYNARRLFGAVGK
jgi:hypothetical protein